MAVKHGYCCKEFLCATNGLLIEIGRQYCIPERPELGGCVTIRFCPWCGKKLKLNLKEL